MYTFKAPKFVCLPNVPERRIQSMLTDYRINSQAAAELKRLGVHLLYTIPLHSLHPAVSGHPDMALHHLGGRYFCCSPEGAGYYQKLLPGAKIFVGNTALERNYPKDIAYNVGRVGNNAFHNLKYTDPRIYEYYKKIGVNLIHVNQGYSKCSICIIAPNAIITEDTVIAQRASENGIDALLICNRGVVLEGLSCGFLGGASGLLDPHTLLVNGNINTHPAYKAIAGFCRNHHVEIHSLHNGRIEDIGSLMPLSEL